MYSYDEVNRELSTAFEYLEMICKLEQNKWNYRGFEAHFHDLSDAELIDILRDMDITRAKVESVVSHIIGYDISSSEGVA
jgi:hypothetical protein